MKRISGLIAVLCLSLFSSLAWSVDINSADAKSLAAELNGVGEKRAQAIVDYRKEHGPFHSIEDLAKVKGVGPVVIEKNKGHLVATQAKQ
jgi:competence protein ComEA